MSETESFKFEISKEPHLSSSIEWGVIGAVSVFFFEFFVLDSLKSSVIDSFYTFVWIFFIILMVTSVKEVRDKKCFGKISFWKSFLISISTISVIIILNQVTWYLLEGAAYGVPFEYFLYEFISAIIFGVVISLIIALAMKIK